MHGRGFELGENLLANLPIGLKCPVDILSGGSREANPLPATTSEQGKLSCSFIFIKEQ
jgi:hypothetical protein